MVRAGSGKTLAQGRARTRKLTKGFRRGRHNLYRQSIVTLIRARRYAFRDRRSKKREFRALWIARINAAARLHGLSYSRLINGLLKAEVEIDRKMLADLAMHDAAAFGAIAAQAKKQESDGAGRRGHGRAGVSLRPQPLGGIATQTQRNARNTELRFPQARNERP